MIKVFRQSAIRIEDNGVIIYFDPYKIEEKLGDATYIFITHEHYDHYDKTSIEKLVNENTKLVVPECLKDINYDKIIVKYKLGNVTFKTIRAYNTNKDYHPKDKNYVGYLVTLNDKTYYIMGDTDVIDEALDVKCDILFVPIGGKFTMDYKEATNYVNKIRPKKVIPIHYGSIVGDISLGEDFLKLIDKDIEVELHIREEML